jgi:bifunctional DNA-binding transcriptional regulator/antitoxin component of YhaV-PrlF toxin-antitoxin module
MRQWYDQHMSGTHAIVMGDRGRLVIPADVRSSANLVPGTPLILVDSPSGLLLLTRAQARAMIKAQLSGKDLVAELLAERRAEAAADPA